VVAATGRTLTGDAIDVLVDVDATSSHPTCGPSDGVLTWTGLYDR
jgi:hypothetical protein